MAEPGAYQIQNLDVLRQIQSPLSMPGGPQRTPSIDVTQASLVYPLNQGWLGMQQHLGYSNAVSINGAGADIRPEAGSGATFTAVGGMPTFNTWRVYDWVQVALSGGTVSPIVPTFLLQQQFGVGVWWQSGNQVNPSVMRSDGPILLQPGVGFRLTCGAGGAGDVITLRWSCRSAVEGVEIPPI